MTTSTRTTRSTRCSGRSTRSALVAPEEILAVAMEEVIGKLEVHAAYSAKIKDKGGKIVALLNQSFIARRFMFIAGHQSAPRRVPGIEIERRIAFARWTPMRYWHLASHRPPSVYLS